MGVHIRGKPEDVAEFVLLPGDPLRAKYIAEKYLQDVHCYSETRGMYGFTGHFQGKRVSVQGTGMGCPSMAIYAYELIHDFKAKTLIRVGTCGGLQPGLELRDVILGLGASSDSAMTANGFYPMCFAPIADFSLLARAKSLAEKKAMRAFVGGVLSTDTFYQVDDPAYFDVWIRHGILGVEMETAALYTLAARWGVQALAILTVSDCLPGGAHLSPDDREKSLDAMIELALALG